MRNLKRFLAVLVVVAVMATSMIPAFAAEETLTAAEICESLNMLRGTGSGVTEEYLATKPDRVQAAIMLLRLMGLEETAIAEGAELEDNFSDVDGLNKTNRAITAYLKAHPELGFVGDQGKFFPTEKITAQQYFKVLLTALGYEQGVDFAWSEVIEFAESVGITAGADAEEFTVADLAEATVEALVANIKGEDDYTLIEWLVDNGFVALEDAVAVGLLVVEEEPAELTATVAATGAKKLTVTFNQPVDDTKAVFTVKRGTVKPSVKSITFSEDKTSAVIEFNINLTSGDYTVEITGLTDEAIVVTTKVEAAKLSTIEFKGDVAIIATGTSDKDVKVGVVGKNQYGEEVSLTLSTSNVFASKGGYKSYSNGVLTLTYDGKYAVGDKVVVTIVDATTSVTASQTFTVAQAAQVESITVGDITTDDKDLAAKPLNVSNLNGNLSKYYIPVEIKDQYGNALKAAELVGVSILTSNDAVINPKGFKDVDGKTVIELQATAKTATHGTVVITVVSGTGKTGSVTITVLENAKIDVVTISAPDSELKIGKAAVLPVTVVDTYGNEIALKDANVKLAKTNEITMGSDDSTKLTATGATFAVKHNYVTNVTTIEITPSDKNVILTVTTSTGKYQHLTLTAVDTPVPTSIKGMKSDFVSMLANDTSMTTDVLGNVEYLDQYGDTISLPGSGYTVTLAAKDTAEYTTSVAGTVYATTKAGTDTYKITLKKGSDVLDEYEVSVTVVDKDKITEFAIDDLNKFYTGAVSSAHNQQVKIYGLVNGKKVEVPQSMIQLVTASNGLPIGNKGAFSITSAVYTDDKDVNATITVLVATKDNTYTLTKDVVYSSAAPKAASLVVKKGSDEVTTAVEVSLADGNLFTGIDGLKIEAKDQYGVAKTTGATFAVTNNDTGLSISIDGNGNLTATGTKEVGKSFTLNVFMDGLYKSVKVVVK